MNEIYTDQEIADSLISGNQWYYLSTITYSFKDERLDYENDSDYEGTVEVSDAYKEATHKIFAYIQSTIGLEIKYSNDEVGDIVLSSKTMDSNLTLGYSYQPTSKFIGQSGDIYLNALFTDEDFAEGGNAYATLLHEIGHALGFNHPFGDGLTSDIDVDDTVMSYNDNDTINGYTYTTYQNADLIALEEMYGLREKVYYEEEIADDIGRLYLSVFERLADKDGLDYWVNEYNETQNLNSIANSFIQSQEFSDTYGSATTDEEFVNLLYENVLYRDADASGLEYWLNELDNGFSQADLVLSFSNSFEYIEFTDIYFENNNISVFESTLL